MGDLEAPQTVLHGSDVMVGTVRQKNNSEASSAKRKPSVVATSDRWKTTCMNAYMTFCAVARLRKTDCQHSIDTNRKS